MDSDTLFETVKHGDVNRVRETLQRVEYDIIKEPRNEAGRTALHVASSCGHFDTMSLLISHGASVNVKDGRGATPLYLASAGGNVEAVRLLLLHGANHRIVDYHDGTTALHVACMHDHTEIAALLLQHGAEVNCRQRYQDKMTPLDLASIGSSPQLVELLISYGADANAKGHYDYTPLHLACEEGCVDIAEILLEAGADIEAACHSIKNSETAIHIASRQGHLEVVNLLIAWEADIDKQDTNGRTALHHASYEGHASVVFLLVTDGASMDITDAAPCYNEYEADEEGCHNYLEGLTPVQMAIEQGHAEVVKVLLERGANLNFLFNKRYGRNPIEKAISSGDIEVITHLISYDTKKFKRCGFDTGSTAIHWACEYGHAAMVSLLIKHGMDCTVEDSFGRTAKDLAINNEILDLLATEFIYRKRRSYILFLARYQFLQPPPRYPRESAIEKVLATGDLHRYIMKFL